MAYAVDVASRNIIWQSHTEADWTLRGPALSSANGSRMAFILTQMPSLARVHGRLMGRLMGGRPRSEDVPQAQLVVCDVRRGRSPAPPPPPPRSGPEWDEVAKTPPWDLPPPPRLPNKIDI